jgi:hypothetical protein
MCFRLVVQASDLRPILALWQFSTAAQVRQKEAAKHDRVNYSKTGVDGLTLTIENNPSITPNPLSEFSRPDHVQRIPMKISRRLYSQFTTLARPRLRPARSREAWSVWEQRRLGEAASLLRDRNSFKGPGNPHARNEQGFQACSKTPVGQSTIRSAYMPRLAKLSSRLKRLSRIPFLRSRGVSEG